MATKEPLLIICKETKIHKPKPRRMNKKSNIVQYNNRGLYMNRQQKQRGQRLDNHELKKLNKLQNFINGEKGKKHSLNLDLISFEEIEKDFKDFKSKSEDIQVQKELIQLIRKGENESFRNECYENYKKIKRPQNPFCKNIE